MCVDVCAHVCVHEHVCNVRAVCTYVHLFFTRYVLYMEEAVSVSHWCVSV